MKTVKPVADFGGDNNAPRTGNGPEPRTGNGSESRTGNGPEPRTGNGPEPCTGNGPETGVAKYASASRPKEEAGPQEPDNDGRDTDCCNQEIDKVRDICIMYNIMSRRIKKITKARDSALKDRVEKRLIRYLVTLFILINEKQIHNYIHKIHKLRS